ncbi:hypothetical protein MGR01S_28200 [Meiothermus granaticius NBRC 107808]|uniref:Uncharacterized protein n=2 Tax=Meiothermus TaxID=65551 RepID=A0A399FBK0_9DEIN|nr:hypothetical protein Mgrana_00063 [Meiothermus granaticius NBRC 107808]GEM88195.1 hypothetical protein MGR01S_28200 [Meiothermus granaticius NBRC 107808]
MESSFSARMRVTDQRCYVLTRPPAWDSYGLRQYIEGMLRDRGWKMLEKKMAYNAVLLELWQAPDGGLLGMALSEAGGSSVNLMTVRLSR